MSPDSSRLRHCSFLLLSIFAFISLCILCRGIYGAVGVHRIKSLISAYSGYKSGAAQAHDPTIDRETFIAIASSTPLQPFTPSAIRAKCAARPWPSDLLFQCQGIHGGIGNVRQETLACMRWALEHGSAIVMPSIHRRKSTNETEDIRNEYETDTVPFDYLFDREVLVRRLGEACPQMRVYERLEDVPFSEGAVSVSAQYVRTPGLRNASWISENRQPVGNITVIDFPGTLLE